MGQQKEKAVKVDNLTKNFQIPLEAHSGLKQKLINTLKGRKGYREFTPLNDISFEIEKGDFFGIVGRNGSGKSTLLKTLAGIYAPDGGAVHVNGTLVPFIELGVGFNPELTGRENVFLNGALLGFSRKQMNDMYEDIVDFAELHDFMEERLKNYSSGMQVRLAFSIAIRADADILLLDEILAVGDEAFQRKCYAYFEELKQKKKTVILVTHSMDHVRKYCNKAMMIREGKVVVNGSPEDVANEYSLENLDSKAIVEHEGDAPDDEDSQQKINPIVSDFKIELTSAKKINQDDEVAIRYLIKPSKDALLKIEMDLQDIDKNTYVYSSNSDFRKYKKSELTEHTVKFKVKELNDMSLRVNSSIKDTDGNLVAYVWHDDAPTFMIRRNDYPGGEAKTFAVMYNRGKWIE